MKAVSQLMLLAFFFYLVVACRLQVCIGGVVRTDVQIGEDHVDDQDESAQEVREERGNEGWKEEDDGEDGLLIFVLVGLYLG